MFSLKMLPYVAQALCFHNVSDPGVSLAVVIRTVFLIRTSAYRLIGWKALTSAIQLFSPPDTFQCFK